MAAATASPPSSDGAPLWDWDAPDHPTLGSDPKYKEFRIKIRSVLDHHIAPHIAEWDEKGEFPRTLHADLYKAGMYGLGSPLEYGGTAPAPLDAWYQYIFNDELARTGTGGLYASLFTMGIAIPPLLAAASDALKKRVLPPVISGQKNICLAITEPNGGSDVANIATTAKTSPCGKFYIVNGAKTFISGGMKADYFTLGVRTGGVGSEGHGALSLLLVDVAECETLNKNAGTIKRTRLKTQGWWCSNTTLITFDNVKVPVANLIGQENAGFLYIMHNFNQERRAIAVMCNRLARICLEDAVRYARARKTFGKPLIQHQVIRHKCAEMMRQILATHGMILYLHNRVYTEGGDLKNDDSHLSGLIALVKVQATKTLEFCAREASQILGGKSYLRGGAGARIERIYREVRVAAIGGGSEEVMLDLAGRQAKL